MNELKATPGPWAFYAKLSASENHRGYCVHGSSIDYWALAEVQPGDEDGVLGKANAALIAAAPELYSACALDAGIEPLLIAATALRSYGNDQLAGILERKHKLEVAALKKARGEA